MISLGVVYVCCARQTHHFLQQADCGSHPLELELEPSHVMKGGTVPHAAPLWPVTGTLAVWIQLDQIIASV